MNLSTEQKLAINMKVARDMWPDAVVVPFSVYGITVDKSVVFIEPPIERDFNIFDPEKGDLNKAVEFYRIAVVPYDEGVHWWECKRKCETMSKEKGRTAAMIKAVTAASGVTV